MVSPAVVVGIATLLLAGAALAAAAGSTAGITQGVLSALAALPVTLALPAAAWWWRQVRLLGEFAPPKAYKPVAGGRPGLEVAMYLRPENQVVGFRAVPQLGELLGWCTAPGRARVGLVTGDGGAGKTRLALQLGRELEGRAWRVLWARQGRLGEAAGLMRNLDLMQTKKRKRPCLLVVDYAETRQQELRELLAAVACDWDGPQVRVVPLARGSGEWWEPLLRRVPGRLETAAPVNVKPLTAEAEVAALFDDAVKAFACQRHIPPPDVQCTVADPAPTVLVVHATALLAVLEHEPGKQGGDSTQAPPEKQKYNSGEDVLKRILAHELNYWEAIAESAELQLDSTDLEQALAAGCLIGADNEGDTAALMERIPGLANKAQARHVARWLHLLYPQASGDRGPQPSAGPGAKQEWIGPLRPDPVAEYLVVDVLARDEEERKELIPSLFTGLDEYRATKALTVLARAAVKQRRAVGLLRAALAANLEHLAVPAASVAVETNDVLGELLADALKDARTSQQISPKVLERIAADAPSPSVALARAAAIVLRRLAQPDQSTGSERAGRLEGLSGRLAELYQPEEALEAVEEAVRIYRSLAGTSPEKLARALNSQSIRLAELGRHREALAVAREAVGIYQELAKGRPEVFAGFLQTLSHRLAELGERMKALKVMDQAAGIYRKVAEDRPACQPELANALNSQAMRLGDLKQHQEALKVVDQAVEIYERLAGAHPDTYRRTLADVLRTRSHQLAELGERTKALKVMDQAAGIYEPLAGDHPGAFRPTLADVRHNLSHRLAALGRPAEALRVIGQAVATYRALAGDHPGAFRPRLAEALHTRSHRLAALGRRREALAVIRDAVGIYQELAGSSPDFKPKLANTLNSQSTRLAELGRHEEALRVIGQAADIYRELAGEPTGDFRPEFAGVLHTRSHRLAGLGRPADALAAIEEAAGIYRSLEAEFDAEFPGIFRPEFAGVLHTRSHRLAGLGRPADALAAIEEAAGIYEPLARDHPGAYRPALADALHTRSYRLAEAGWPAEEALAAIEETVKIWRLLEADFPGAFKPQLARALNSLSIRLAGQGRYQEALAAAEEAVETCRSLEAEFDAEFPGVFRPDLADFLLTLSCRLADLGWRAEALAAAGKAVETCRRSLAELAADFPGVFEPKLASALNNLEKLRQ